MKLPRKPLLIILAVLAGIPFITAMLGSTLFRWYIDAGANRLLKLEKEGKLSRTYGYVWEQINRNSALSGTITRYGTGPERADENASPGTVQIPSLSAVEKLNHINSFNKTISINDRYGIPLAQLKTTHTCLPLSAFNDILIESLIITEDKHFYTRKKGYDFPAIVRSILFAALRSVRTFSLQYPRGTSTIHMQVARFLLLKYNSEGYAYTDRTLARKLLELKLAQALCRMYSPKEILTVYVNHCVSVGRGMTGYHDISTGLFGVKPDALSEPQSLYLARLVKWNRQVPSKIIRQIKASLQELAPRFNWDQHKLVQLRTQLDTLTFGHPTPTIPENSYLIDCANEYLRSICRLSGMNAEQVRQMDLTDPESNLRRFGNADINLTIDYRLQRFLERIVAKRGFGPDTARYNEVRVGYVTEILKNRRTPPDTARKATTLLQDTTFTGPSSGSSITMKKGDTLVCSVTYRRLNGDSVRRHVTFYRQTMRHLSGQYYAYAIMDSRTRKLLAYCSKDRLGSRLRSLLVNRTPNGSSVAKPLIYALAYDLDIYQPTDMAADDREVPDSCLWARSCLLQEEKPVGMIYHNVQEKEGYHVHNHDHAFSGYDFLFNHLAHSNNILAVETMYRLTSDTRSNDTLFRKVGNLLTRLDAGRKKQPTRITGPELYCAPVSIIRGKRINTSKRARNYSIALGTLELSLYEQLHLFNALYDGKLVTAPARHPSLFIKSIRLSDEPVPFTDSITTVTLFTDVKKLAPVHLALHKRLISNPSDRLDGYDFRDKPSTLPGNFAKSGTTDDVIRPFNAPDSDSARTNYGLWNAAVRIRLNRDDLKKAIGHDTLIGDQTRSTVIYEAIPDSEILDITVACIGECNTHYTGNRDGKTLHGYVSRELLHAFGIPCSSGFYHSYENELLADTPDKVKYAADEKSDLSLFSRALINLQTGIGGKVAADEVRFEKPMFGKGMRLKGKHFRKMLTFASYMGENARRYNKLLNRLKHPESKEDARNTIGEISSIEISNQALKRDLERACSSLLQSLTELEEDL